MMINVHQPSTPPALTKPDSLAQACVRGSLENWAKVQYFSTKPCWPIWAVWLRYFPQTLHSKPKPFIPEILFSTPLTDLNVATCCPLSFYHSPGCCGFISQSALLSLPVSIFVLLLIPWVRSSQCHVGPRARRSHIFPCPWSTLQ